jgi:isochorismate hydrolase
MSGQILVDRCLGAIVDVQEFFLSQIESRALRARTEKNITSFARLLRYFRIPILATLERPLVSKGGLPAGLDKCLRGHAAVLEKDYFDLSREKKISAYLRRLRKKQVIIAGCETDVCILQSCLGLLAFGYEVYVVEDLLFSSSDKVDAAIARMRGEGAVFLTYKSLYYELIESVEGGPHGDKQRVTFGPFPDDLPDCVQ